MSRGEAIGAGAKAVTFLGYGVGVSAVVVTWAAYDPAAETWRVVALGCVFALSILLGRRLPGWGFAAPVVVALMWLAVILATTPAPDIGDEPPTARALEVFFLLIATLAAEAGVFLGSMTAVWSWTRAR